MMKIQCNMSPLTVVEYLKCEKWEQDAFSRSWEKRYGRLSRLYGAFYEPYAPETLLGGACFDFPNLQKQILSVELPERNPLQPAEGADSTDTKVADNVNYIPQYSRIKFFLLQCRSKEELAVLKKTAIDRLVSSRSVCF